MNFIDNIEIKNFKSIRHQKIEGCKRVNVFIGYPNVGKSNILEALSGYSLLSRRSVHTKSLKSLMRFSRFSDIFFNADTRNPSSVTINNEEDLIYSLSDLENLKLIISGLSEKTKIPDSTVSRRKGEIYLNANITPNGDFTYSVFLDLEQTGKVFIKRYSFNPEIQFQSSASLSLNIPYGENLNDIVEINPELRKEFNEILKQYNLNLNFDRTKADNKLELRRTLPDGTTITLGWNLIADTLRRLFFYKAAILSNKNSILLFEEPEAHLFPRYISKLTGQIILNENSNQYFMATHSPYVLNDLINDLGYEELALFIVSYSKEKGETVIQRMTEAEMNEAYQFGYDFFMNINNFIQPQPHD